MEVIDNPLVDELIGLARRLLNNIVSLNGSSIDHRNYLTE
jgi:hypothetical protein